MPIKIFLVVQQHETVGSRLLSCQCFSARLRLRIAQSHHVVALVALLIAGLSAAGLTAAPLHAQNPDPATQVFSTLVSNGYDVIEVGYFPDAQGKPSTNAVYAEMETFGTKFTDRYTLTQGIRGFRTLAKYFPNVEYYIVALHFDRWLFFFVTTPADLDDLSAQQISPEDFWAKAISQVRIYDTVDKRYITPKDFSTQNQTNKNQTNKDFSGQANSPLPPVNTNPNAKPENILLEPSTTYLPADGAAQAWVMATLTDQDYAGLPDRGVNFAYEVRGQDPKALGAAQTDRFGTARSKIASSRALDVVLLRASTTTLNAELQIVVGDPPGDDVTAQKQAVVAGLKSQGYTDVDSGYNASTGPDGKTYNLGLAAVRVTSRAFDRTVYSQLLRMLGTLRTVMKDANFLRPILEYAAPDGHDYLIVFNLRTDLWDAYVRGDIGENQLWSSLDYVGAINENGVFSNEKDFISKNFSGTPQARASNAPRQVASTLTTESWGDQLTVGTFLVPVGGFADTFAASNLSGSATGFAIFQTPDYNKPVFVFKRGDDAALQGLRLEEGQYILEVTAPGAPGKIELNYVEHLLR